MDIKRMMEIQLQSRLRNPEANESLIPEATMKIEPSIKLDEPNTWLGKNVISYKSLSPVIESLIGHVESSVYVSSLRSVGGTNGVLRCIHEGFNDKQSSCFLAKVYIGLLERLNENNIKIETLAVVTTICAGGIPFTFYGLHASSSVEEVIERHLELAQNHGILLDLIPLTFGDFESNLVKMAIGIASILISKLEQRDKGLCRSDAIMFACKGTLPVAMCLDEYALRNEQKKQIVGIGFGTDLLQGFVPPPNEGYEDPIWEDRLLKRSEFSHVLVFNTLGDSAVGSGRISLDSYVQQMNYKNSGEHANKAIWLDILPELDHNWYDNVLTHSQDKLFQEIFQNLKNSL